VPELPLQSVQGHAGLSRPADCDKALKSKVNLNTENRLQDSINTFPSHASSALGLLFPSSDYIKHYLPESNQT
jgi:hypothetical protein